MTEEKTLSERIKEYEKNGYTRNFELTENYLRCIDTKRKYDPKDFHIVEVYRFDGMTNPDDEAVLYVIEADEGKTKGLLVDAYGMYADSLSFEMIEKLKIDRSKSGQKN
ncbi:MAG: phosphoribosylpyrophosphate synthetase [Crocinitomicaceae bacterium]